MPELPDVLLYIEALKPRLAKYGPAVQQRAGELYAVLDADAGKQLAKLEEIATNLPAGDVRRPDRIGI